MGNRRLPETSEEVAVNRRKKAARGADARELPSLPHFLFERLARARALQPIITYHSFNSFARLNKTLDLSLLTFPALSRAPFRSGEEAPIEC